MATVVFAALILIRAGTSPLDVVRYAIYAGLAVILPGALVYRALRGRPRTLVDDLAMGAAVGLVLELAGWALFSSLDLRPYVWLWPLLVVLPFVAIPGLRRHWRVRGYAPAPLGWSWAVAAIVCFFTAYLAAVFLDRNPIIPPSETTRQYLDLSYQLSLAGEATHAFPPGLPQVAAEPLAYHWFAYAHMAMTSMVGHIDVPVVALRLAVPGLCALAIVLTAVVGWRVSGRPLVGAGAAALFFAVGEFNFTNPVTLPFGTQVTFVIWHGISMIYAWVLMIALIAPLSAIARKSSTVDTVDARGTGDYGTGGALALTALLVLGSSGAKASSLPVIGLALAIVAVVSLVIRRRIPWALVAAGLACLAGQLFATVVLYNFQTYGVAVGPLSGLSPYWGASPSALVVAGVWVAFALNMLLRLAGLGPLLWLTRGRLDPAQWLLLAGGVAGILFYLVLSQPGSGNQYFLRTGFAFGVIGSAWGYALVLDRARLSTRGAVWLGVGTAGFAGVLIGLQLRYAEMPTGAGPIGPLSPLLSWAGWLAAVGLAAGLSWFIAGHWFAALRGRGAVVALTAVLVAGIPGLVMDGAKSVAAPNGGAYPTIGLPKSQSGRCSMGAGPQRPGRHPRHQRALHLGRGPARV